MPTKPRTGNIQQRGKRSFRIRYLNHENVRQEETIKGTREDAERELAIRLGEIAKGLPVSSRPNTVLFDELAADVITDYEINDYSSRDDLDGRFRLHILPVFGRRKAAQITTAQIKWYIKERLAEGAKTGTVNRELEAIRHVFNLAIEGRKLLFKPYVPTLQEQNVREGFFTRDEVERLCRFLGEPLKEMVLFAFLTGWRLGDCRSLLWRHVDFAKNEIRLPVGSDKNRSGRVFPMFQELRALLSRLDEASDIEAAVDVTPSNQSVVGMPGKVVRAKGTLPVFPVGDFRKQWRTACFRAGLPCIVKPIIIRGKPQRNEDGSPKVKVLKALRTFHDLRRSFAREMDKRHIRQGAIMKLGGWKTDSVFKRYNIVTEADLRDAIESLDGDHKTDSKKRGRDA